MHSKYFYLVCVCVSVCVRGCYIQIYNTYYSMVTFHHWSHCSRLLHHRFLAHIDICYHWDNVACILLDQRMKSLMLLLVLSCRFEIIICYITGSHGLVVSKRRFLYLMPDYKTIPNKNTLQVGDFNCQPAK